MAQRMTMEAISVKTLKAVARKQTKVDAKIAALEEQKKQIALDEFLNQCHLAAWKYVKDLIKESGLSVCGGIADAGTSIYPRFLYPGHKIGNADYAYANETVYSDPTDVRTRKVQPRAAWSQADFDFLADDKTNYALEAHYTLPLVAKKVSDTITSFTGQRDKALEEVEKTKAADALEIVLQSNGITFRRVGTTLLAQI